MSVKTAVLAALAMVAFAANSILCRLALGAGLIDPASFTAIRILSGAAMLAILLVVRDRRFVWRTPDLGGATALFIYMAGFSFAYVTLDAGVGALVLFGCVQITMFAVAVQGGERFGAAALGGLALAIAGLFVLVAPGAEAAHDLLGAVSMAAAGIAWGAFTLAGRGRADPLAATGGSFLAVAPAVVLLWLIFAPQTEVSGPGLALAIASGALASGVGYAIWYAALRALAASHAAIIQLSVPALAALGGVLLLGEALTARLAIASLTTLAGIFVFVRARRAT
ncbi:MAG: DMT family transporter [Pseudomonadota bacterium]